MINDRLYFQKAVYLLLGLGEEQISGEQIHMSLERHSLSLSLSLSLFVPRSPTLRSLRFAGK